MHTRWAILGLGAISRDFVAALRASEHGVLWAAGSSSPERAERFALEHGATVSGSYDDVLARDDVDAVYVSTVHTSHRELAIRALEAGKAVLCEKPAAPELRDVEAILDAAARAGRPFVEAHKSRFSPFADALDGLVAETCSAGPRGVQTTRGGASTSRHGRLFDPRLGGGAILDIGCYPVALAVQVAAALGEPVHEPRFTRTSAQLVSGVDGTAFAEFSLGALDVSVGASIVRELPPSASIRVGDDRLFLPDPWGSRSESPSAILVRHDGTQRWARMPAVQPMAAEADAVSLAIAEGGLEAPQMPWEHTRAIARILTVWRERALIEGAGHL